MPTEDDYKTKKLPYVRTEFGVVRDGVVVFLGPAVNRAGAKAYAKQQGLKLMSRSVSDWLEVKA